MKRSISGIYKITNLVNKKIYIGQSTNILSRWEAEKHGYGVNPHLQNSIQKYGIDKFSFEIIKECQECDLDTFESFFIFVYCSFNDRYGYNKTFGGGTPTFTNESRSKMSNSQTNRFSDPDQRKQTGVLTKTAMTNPQIINRMKINRKGWYDRYDNEKKKNYEKTMHLAISGDKHWTRNKNFSDESRRKSSLSHMGQKPPIDRGWYTKNIETGNIFTSYKNIKDFLQKDGFNLSESSIRSRIYKATQSGKLAYGYHWIKIHPSSLFT
jgi:group I intron endonuclease